jgi:ferric-dicitrate binding protein FerR (iron transport regulator)
MDERIDFDLVDRYLRGEAGAAERALVDARAAADPEFRALLDEARGRQPVWDTDRAWARFREQMQPQPRVRRSWRAPALALAAVLVIALGVVFVLQRRGPFEATQQVASLVHTTTTGERKSVTLADGSMIELAPASRLSVSADFGRKERAVTLEGEAFFQVTPDAEHPFVVRSVLAETRVLGTSFDVRAYAGFSVQVAVTSGRVRVQATEALDSAVLDAGEAAEVAQGGQVEVRTVDVAELTAWRKGRLLFRDMSFADVAPVLERWYGIEVVISDSVLAETHVSAMFQQQPVEDVLQALAETLGARYEHADARVTFRVK